MLFEDSTAVKFNNNHRIVGDSRQMQIDFVIEGMPKRVRGNTPLASFVLPLNDINERCQNYDHPARLEIPLCTPNQQLLSGAVTVEVRRIRLDRSYAEGKARDAFKGLMDQVVQIGRFNADHKGAMEMSLNVRGREGASFLNAAIKLVRPTLIFRLRDFGYRFSSNRADPHDPLMLAISTRDRAREKLEQKLKSAHVDANAIRASEDRVKELDEMVETLMKMSQHQSR